MTIIEGLVYLMLTMVLGSAVVGNEDRHGEAKFCFMCVEMQADTQTVITAVPEVEVPEVEIPEAAVQP